jgi:hypothetical protein
MTGMWTVTVRPSLLRLVLPGEEDWTIWFVTRRSSRKAADIQRAGLKARDGSTHCEVVEQIAAGLNILRLPSHKARMKNTGAKAARSLKRCVPPV